MKLVYTSSLLALLAKNSEAVTCYSCTDLAFNADETADAAETCWHPDATTPTITCTDGTQTCGEAMTFLDGWPQSVSRGCNTLLTGASEDTPGETRNTVTCSNELNQFRNVFDPAYPVLAEEFASTTCQADCTTDLCNLRVELEGLSICDPSRNTPNDGTTKWCDFITGTWMCKAAFGGGVASDNVACVAPVVVTVITDSFTPISCIQCNSETDGASCWTKTSQTACEDETFVSCTSETTITYNKETGDKLRESITRGCSTAAAGVNVALAGGNNGPVFDQCHWSSNEEQDQLVFGIEKEAASGKWLGEPQLNCVLRCDPSESGAGCNGVPNGSPNVVDTDTAAIVCAKFDVTGDAAAATGPYEVIGFEICGAGVTECYSEVTYMVRGMQAYSYDPVTDAQDRVRILAHKRGCKTASMEIEDACVTDESFSASANVDGIDLKKVTCSEVCEGDDCNNNNWPMRPKCLQDGVMFNNAFGADYVQPCSSPAHSACTVQEYNMIHEASNYKRFVDDHVVASGNEVDFSQNLGFSTTIRRGCVIEESDVPTGCSTNGHREGGRFGYKNSLFFENCNFTCTDDGCNFGTGYSSSLSVVASMGALVIAFLMN